MRIEQLIYLTDIAQTKSISTTAQRVFMSQQAVSESIRSLERELGCSLFNRSKTGVTLTSKGQVAVEYASDIVAQYHAMLSALPNIEDTYDFSGKLLITTSPMVSASIIPNVQKELKKQCPSMELQLQNAVNNQVIKNIAEYISDLGFCYYPSTESSQLNACREQYPALEFRKLHSEQIVHCVRKDSAHFSQKDEHNNMLMPKGLVIYFSSSYATTEKQSQHQLTTQPVQYDSFLVSDDIALIGDLILRYDAICTMSELAYRMFFNYREYAAIPYSKTISDDLYCVYDSNRYEPHFDIVINAVEREIRNILRKQLEY